MLPVPCDGPLTQMMQCDPRNSPSVPNIGEMHPMITPFYPFICGMALNEITAQATNNAARMFCYNMASANGWRSETFAEICRLITEYIQMQLVNNRANDVQNIIHNAVNESVAAFSGYLFTCYPEMKNYCVNDVCDMAYRSNEFFRRIKADIANYRSQVQGQYQQQQHYPQHQQQYHQNQGQNQYHGRGTQSYQHGGTMSGRQYPQDSRHLSNTPGNRFTRSNSNQQQQQQRHSDYSPGNSYGHNTAATNMRFGNERIANSSAHEVVDVYDDIEEIEASFIKQEDRSLAIADGSEHGHATAGITMMGAFVPMNFEQRYRKASQAANDFTDTTEPGETYESIQEFQGVLTSSTLSVAYTAMCESQLEAQGVDKFNTTMYRAGVEVSHFKIFNKDATEFKNGLLKSATMSQFISFLRGMRDGEIEDDIRICMVIDKYLTKRMNHFMKRNLQRTEWFDSAIEDWATALEYLTKQVSQSAASGLNRFMNDIIAQMKIANDMSNETDEEVRKIISNRIFFIETAVITRMFQYEVELGYKVKDSGCVIEETTAPVLRSIAGSSAIYANRIEFSPQQTYIVTADDVWYEIIYREEMDEYLIYPANTQPL